jgi:hypothetical protein
MNHVAMPMLQAITINNFMEIQNVTFAKKHGTLVASGFREISPRENQ